MYTHTVTQSINFHRSRSEFKQIFENCLPQTEAHKVLKAMRNAPPPWPGYRLSPVWLGSGYTPSLRAPRLLHSFRVIKHGLSGRLRGLHAHKL